MKRFLSVLLTLAMLLSLVSVSAVAEGKELLTIDVYDDAANYNGIPMTGPATRSSRTSSTSS